ncbi:hypothetical protein KPH14_012085 [Odynerus spinipes]|uniref:RAP domain-containing protein n=1 Tax=Odynerus spinipes TaxID=1348599 RepID=A0AAD9RA74_9HYME|nr:hypothetical protein KPH14_012085 [Odynerus spinipes]
MLQFNSSLYNSTLKLFPYWRLSSLLSTSVVNPEITNLPKQDNIIQDHANLSIKNEVLQKETAPEEKSIELPDNIKKIKERKSSKAELNNQIRNAKSTTDLIGIMKMPGITIEHVRQILSLISSKSTNVEKTNVSLVKATDSLTNLKQKKIVFDNLKILPLATPSLIQILKKLSYNSERNVPLLRTLAYNIAMYSERLNIKMCGDILYSLAVLNYYDENLINKVMLDLFQEIPKNSGAPVFGSIVTSIGLLRYKRCEVLDVICKWAVDNYEQLRVQDFIATLQCFATFGYNPPDMDLLKQHMNSLKKEDTNDDLWLDFVWSLILLDKALPSHIASVLDMAFVKTILNAPDAKRMSRILKLLNINGAAEVLLKDYNGPMLNTTADIFTIPLERRKQKQEFIDLLTETLKEIVPLRFQINVYTKMGFYIDAECYLNSNKEFVRIDDVTDNSTNTRVAIMVHDYHDYSRGKEELLGVIQFYNKILTAKGYKVLNISYHNFSVNDKLVKRVHYLNEQIKSLSLEQNL